MEMTRSWKRLTNDKITDRHGRPGSLGAKALVRAAAAIVRVMRRNPVQRGVDHPTEVTSGDPVSDRHLRWGVHRIGPDIDRHCPVNDAFDSGGVDHAGPEMGSMDHDRATCMAHMGPWGALVPRDMRRSRPLRGSFCLESGWPTFRSRNRFRRGIGLLGDGAAVGLIEILRECRQSAV